MVAFDFTSIKNRIIDNLRSKEEWSSFLSFGVVENLIDPICQELAYANQYQEYLTFENWWSKARNKSSLLVQSPVHGYVVPRKKGATGSLLVSTDKNFNKVYSKGIAIHINKFFQFSGNNVYVASAKNYILTSEMANIEIECKQGESKVVAFTALGQTYEEKLIEDDSVDNDFYELYVNGVLWKRVDTLFEYNSEDQVYEIETKSDLSGIKIKFGNNIYGRKLELNDKVEFKYLSTNGSEGNIFSADIIKQVETQAFDEEGRPVKLYVKNISPIIGGQNYTSIDEIRTLSPRVYQTGDRASSAEDYLTKIKQFPYISKVNVWGAYENLKDKNLDPWTFIPTEENVVHVALLDQAFENLTDIEKTQVIDDLHSKNDPTDIVQFEVVEKIPLTFTIDATIENTSYSIIQVQSNIEQALINAYGIANIQFNTNLYNSDFIRLVDEVEGVKNHQSSIQLTKEFELSEPFVGSFELPMYPLTNTNFLIYMKNLADKEPQWEPFATCDINGRILGIKYNTSGSTMSLSSGKGVLVVNDLKGDYETYRFKVYYSYIDLDLVLRKRSDIFCFGESNITLHYPIV